MKLLNAVLCGVFASMHSLAQQVQIAPLVDRELPSLVAIYKGIHAVPELSHYEKNTSAILAKELRTLGFAFTEPVGKYSDPNLNGYGVVAEMTNGAGPTVMIRADMDAPPIEAQTALPYASRVRAKDDSGQDVPVMHACGHDIHVATLIGTARVLAELKTQWSGTPILIGQPSEEKFDGARAMLRDGLYTRFPRPNCVLALHDSSELETGKIGYIIGNMAASATSVDVVLRGRGGHGAYPQKTIDPIVMAAQYILAIQNIVSRENSPLDPAVVTVGSIHGGTKRNIIPDEVRLEITVRAYKEEVRQRILSSLDRIAKGIALEAGVPPDRAPLVKVSDTEGASETYNDPALTMRVVTALKKALGTENVVEIEPVMGSEDFGQLGLEGHQIPIMMFRVGAIDAERIAKSNQTGIPLPSTHSSLFWPIPEPTIRTGVLAMTTAALDLMGR